MKYLWQRHSYPERTMEHSPFFFVLFFVLISLLKSLGMIDVDTKYIDDEAMDFVFKETKTHNTPTSSIVRNHVIPETPPPPPPQVKVCLHSAFLKQRYWA